MTSCLSFFIALCIVPGSVSVAFAQSLSPGYEAVTVTGTSLDLRLGDIRKFVPAEQLNVPLDEVVDEVVVRSPRTRMRLPERLPIPRGAGGVRWLLDHPTQFWRLFVPDPNTSPLQTRSFDDPSRVPGAHRMLIGEPGRAL